LLKIFSQEAEQEITVSLEPATEEEAYNIDFVGMHEELEILERNRCVQQDKLETNGRSYQPGEQLEEVGDMPTWEELTEEANMSVEETEQQVIQEETAELEFAVEWNLSATRGYEDNMGDQVDLPIDKEVRHKRLHKNNQPLE